MTVSSWRAVLAESRDFGASTVCAGRLEGRISKVCTNWVCLVSEPKYSNYEVTVAMLYEKLSSTVYMCSIRK